MIGLLASGLLPILSGSALATTSLPSPLTLPMPRPSSATTAIAASPASLATSMMLADAAAAPGLQITYDRAAPDRPDDYMPVSSSRDAEMAAVPRDAHDMANGGVPQFRRPDSFAEAYRPGNQWMFHVLSIDLDQN